MANTYVSYSQIGIKEDVQDMISNISPTKTPFQSLIGTESISNRTHSWQEDALAAVNTSNQQLDGADASETACVPTVLRTNHTQILSKSIKISASADAMDTYGRDKETAYQTVKSMEELKRDLEYMLVGRVQAAVTGNSTLARRMASAWSQITATTADVTAPDGSTGTTGVQTSALTESLLLDAFQELYTNGGEADYFMIKPSDSRIVAGFAAASGRERDFGSSKKIVNAVDLYVSPYGEVKVILNRFQLVTGALLFAPKYWKLLVLRRWKQEELAKIGDSTRKQIVGEFSLKHKNFLASESILNLSGS